MKRRFLIFFSAALMFIHPLSESCVFSTNPLRFEETNAILRDLEPSTLMKLVIVAIFLTQSRHAGKIVVLTKFDFQIFLLLQL